MSIDGDDSPREPEAGQLVAGRYELVAERTRRAGGVLYRALDRVRNETVALGRIEFPSDELLARLRNEIRLGQRLRHPAFYRVLEVGEAEGFHFVTLEWVDGEDLASLLERIGRLAPGKVLEIARVLLEALADAEAVGVVRRGLRPSHLMLDSDGRLRVSAYGIRESRPDMRAVGVVLYELLTGRSPREEGDRGTIPERPSKWARGVDRRLERAVLASLAPDTGSHPASAREMAALLSRDVDANTGADARIGSGPLTPFVGRTHELGIIRDRWEDVCGGHGHRLLVTGEPGIGKSRLVQEFRAGLVDLPHRWLELQCTRETHGTRLHAATEMLRQVIGVDAAAPEQEQKSALDDLLAKLDLEDAGIAQELRGLLSPSPGDASDRDRHSAATSQALLAMTHAVGRDHPYVFVLEDLEWADAETLALLRQLLAVAPGARSLGVHTAGPEFDPEWPVGAYTRIDLSPLGPGASRDLVRAAAGEPLSDAEVDVLAQDAAGNPRRLEEGVAHWRRSAKNS